MTPTETDPRPTPLTWERLERLTPREAVVTGEAAAEEPVDRSVPGPLHARPLLIFVRPDPEACDGNCRGACQRYFEADDAVFGEERLVVAARAFRPIWMLPEDAEHEPLLERLGRGAVPRLVLLDVARRRYVVLQTGRLRASRVYEAMENVAARFYEERLEEVVDQHLELLAELHELALDEKRLYARQLQRGDDAETRRVRKELELVGAQRRAVDRKIEVLWTLTPKGT